MLVLSKRGTGGSSIFLQRSSWYDLLAILAQTSSWLVVATQHACLSRADGCMSVDLLVDADHLAIVRRTVIVQWSGWTAQTSGASLATPGSGLTQQQSDALHVERALSGAWAMLHEDDPAGPGEGAHGGSSAQDHAVRSAP